MYQEDDILFLDHFDKDDADDLNHIRAAKYVVSEFGTLLKGVDAKYGLVGSTFDRRLLKDPTPKTVPIETHMVRYDLTLLVEEPDAMPGEDIFCLALLAQILEAAGYDSKLATNVTKGAGLTMVLKKRTEPK